MIRFDPNDYIPMNQFLWSWLFTDPDENPLPADAVREIHPLDFSRVAPRLDKFWDYVQMDTLDKKNSVAK